MAVKGKEPAGLRRYRLAQKRKKSGGRKRRVVRAAPTKRRRKRVVATMARRRYSRKKKRRGGRGKGAIPLLPIAGAMVPAMKVYDAGLNKDTPKAMLFYFTGWNTDAGQWDSDVAIKSVSPIILGYVGHKVATKLGVNRYVRKLSMGYFVL